jgi:hypothetical protein
MSAMPAEKLREPEQLYTPDFPAHMVHDIENSLTEAGGREFFRQVRVAYERARLEGDLRPLNDVFESWYRTLVFASDPSFEGYWDEAQKTTDLGMTAEELRAKRLAGRPNR